VHLDRVFGSLFVDAGNAWGPDVTPSGFTNALRDPLVSVGAELTTEFLGLFDTLVPLRLGVGVPLVSATGAQVYLRVGVAF
jgi:hypothetical protein